MLKAGGKGNAFKRRRWFVLRGDVISYYKQRVSYWTAALGQGKRHEDNHVNA